MNPDTGDIPFRRTEQAILQVQDSARQRITLVSFAVYRIPNIADLSISEENAARFIEQPGIEKDLMDSIMKIASDNGLPL